jgi:hypothetical protein
MHVYYACRVFHRMHARILVYIFTDERVAYLCKDPYYQKVPQFENLSCSLSQQTTLQTSQQRDQQSEPLESHGNPSGYSLQTHTNHP